MILILNPNTSTATTQAMVEIARATDPALVVEGWTAPFGAPMIVEPAALATGARAVEAMAAEVGSGVAGVIVAAFGDPGIGAARARLACPVAGIGEAGIGEAAAGGRRFGIATTTPALEASLAALIEARGLTPLFTGSRFTRGDALALTADPAALALALEEAVEACVADGAEAVVIGGGPLARAARALAHRVAVPVVEPVPAAVRLIRRRIAAA